VILKSKIISQLSNSESESCRIWC